MEVINRVQRLVCLKFHNNPLLVHKPEGLTQCFQFGFGTRVVVGFGTCCGCFETNRS